MCVIIQLPANKVLPKKTLEDAYDTNPHGWGMMYPDKSKKSGIIYYKKVADFNKFWQAWQDVPTDVERAIHFRIKTHGDINDANCHPFFPADYIGLMHNGTIDVDLTDSFMSDTHNFAKYKVTPLIKTLDEIGVDFMTDKGFKELMENWSGFSKLLFMSPDGKTLRTNDFQWVVHDGCYFSNSHSLYKTSNKRSFTGYRSNRHYDYEYDYDNWNKKEYEALEKESNVLSLPAKKDVLDIKSDLYSGFKTDQEGQDYVKSKENEDDKYDEVIDGQCDVIEEEEDQEVTYTANELLMLAPNDLADWVQDNPEQATLMLEDLLLQLLSAGKLSMGMNDEATVVGEEPAEQKSVSQ